jgi:hypothetical protein
MQWKYLVTFLALAGAALAAGDDRPRTFHFTKDDLGKLPAGWKAEHTGQGEGSVWKVVADDTAPSGTGCALAQTAEGPDAFFNLCVAEDTNHKDLELSVSFKAVRGKEDQGGGLAWRYRDHDNYYICRMNPLEDNFRVYKVVKGQRKQFESRGGLKVPAGEWHKIKIAMLGDHIQCWLDGNLYLDVHDDTFHEAGKIGLWSKADAQSYFDDLKLTPR